MIFKNQDEKLKKRVTISENDVFWDISDITPAKKSERRTNVRDIDNGTALIEADNTCTVNRTESIPRSENFFNECVRSYLSKDSLLDSVNVFLWHSKYTFYERFCLDAHKYFSVEAEECEHVKYFSYMPSFIQMSNRQKKWYFYWRSGVRQGEYLPTDSSYVLLFVYEIINLPDLISAQEGIALLCEIWKNYRTSYTKLDKYMSEWVCDYCLINELEMPYEKIKSFISDAVDQCVLKQFYIPVTDGQDAYSSLLFAKMSVYKWWKSKYITDDNRELFEKHIRAGFAYAIRRLALSDGRFDGSTNTRLTQKKTARDSFSGALCAYHVKRRIEVSYTDLCNIGGIGFIITDLVRYCENRVRSHLGIRAKLSVQNLTEEQRRAVDEYFDLNLPAKMHEKKRKKIDEYELPEQETHNFSVNFDRAKEIEEASWQTTDRLIEDLYGEYELTEDKPSQKEEAVKEEISIESETLDIARTALRMIAENDHNALSKLADESYMMTETLVECVNELCFELLGDVGVEEKDGRYVLIPDYEQEIRQWLNL